MRRGYPAVLVAAARGPLAFIVLGAAGIAVTWRTGDDPGWGVGRPGPGVTPAGLAQAAGTTAHAIAGACGVLLLAATTPVTDLLGWARRRGAPDVVLDVAGLVYRLLFVLLQVSVQVRDAQTARLGYATRRATLRSASLLTTAVLSRAWDHAHRLETGLAGRGLDGPLRVLDDHRPSSPRFVAATLALLTGLAAAGLLTPHLPLPR